MNLEQINTQTTWSEASNRINQNNQRINEAVMRLENSTYKNKGYFKTLEQLQATYPQPSSGSKAYVGIASPYTVYVAENGTWISTYIGEVKEEVYLEGYFTKEEYERLERTIPQEEFDRLKEEGLLDPKVTYNTYEE